MKRFFAGLGVAAALVAAVAAIRAFGQVYSATTDAGIFFVYDPVGRLVGVVTPNGNVAQYVYDPAGNITAIDRYDGGFQVLGFAPNGAAPGSTITIYGSGFTSGDTVTIGGQSATVDSVTPTEIVATVPAGAAGGTVSVVSGGNSSNSSWTLSVPDSGISITRFSPDAGDAGGLLTITGSGFDPNPANDVVLINITQAVIVDAGPINLVVTIPFDTSSGKVTVADGVGSAVSTGDVYIPPPGYLVSAVAAAGRATIGGSAATLSSIPSGSMGLLLFDAQAGDQVGIAVTSVAGSASVQLYDPKGETVGTDFSASAATTAPEPPLRYSGTYQLVVSSTSSPTTIALQIIADATGVLDAGGSALLFSPSQAGQEGAFTFAGNEGENFTLALTSDTFSSLTVNVYEPGGTLFFTSTAEAILKIPTLLASGTYLVVLTTTAEATGHVDIQLLEDVEGTITVGGSMVPVYLVPGQYAHFTFSGTTSQLLDLALPGYSSSPSGDVEVVIDEPPLASEAYDWYTQLFSAANHSYVPALAETGTFNLWMEPQTAFTFDGGILLALPQTGALTIGTPTTYTTTVAGQEGLYTFSADAGQSLSLVTSGCTFGSEVTLPVYGPTGSTIQSCIATSSYADVCDLENLAATGTYTVAIQPYGANTGQVTVEVLQDASGTLPTDGGALAVLLDAGQRGDYTFSANAGDYLGGGVTSFSTAPSGSYTYLYVNEPSGSNLASIYVTGNTSYTVAELPVSGTYTMRVEPEAQGAASASFNLEIAEPLTGTMADGGPANTFNPSVEGQEGVYTFTGTAGNNATIFVSAPTFAHAIYIYVYKPSGAELTEQAFSSSGSISLTNLPATGTYTVLVNPEQTGTGSVTLTLN